MRISYIPYTRTIGFRGEAIHAFSSNVVEMSCLDSKNRVIETISQSAIDSGSKLIVMSQVTGVIVLSSLCAMDIHKAIKSKLGKKVIIKKVVKYGVGLVIVYFIPEAVELVKEVL